MAPSRRQRRCRIAIAVLSIAMAAGGRAQSSSDFDEAGFSARVAEMHARTAVPGLAVAVMQDGEILHLRGYGEAGPDGRPVTGRTCFQIGSITKSFVALVILQLAAEGELGLDDPVVKHLPTFRTADKAASDRITIDHLVTHHSGLTTLDGNRRHAPTGRDDEGPAQAVADLASAELFAEPGSRFQYSNANYVVLSHLIEVLDGRPFEQALTSRIFEPLGLANSFVRRPTSDEQDVATGYRSWFQFARPTEYTLDRRMIGAGGISASAEDLARYVVAVQTRDPRIVPADADRLFQARPFQGSLGYAYGWIVYQGPDGDLVSHEGASPGFSSLAAIDTETGRAVVVLTNLFGISPGRLAQAVTHEALGLEPVEARASLSTQLALWSGVMAVLGIALWLVKTGRRLFIEPMPMRTRVRWLNAGAAVGLGGLVAAVLIVFPHVVGTTIASARLYFPDLVLILFTGCGLAVVLALGRLALAVRSRPLDSSR
jgi:CubicO group peptidase (beta-lactamase class C family)